MSKIRSVATIVGLLLAVLSAIGLAQEESKYVGREADDPLAVFLVEADEQVTGALMLEYGALIPFEGEWEGRVLRGELVGSEPPTEFEARRRGRTLRFTLLQGNERQEFGLVRQAGEKVSFDTPLLRMLSLVPDVLSSRTGTPGVNYIDYRALERAAGVENPGSASGFAALSETQRSAWFEAFRRVNAGPRDLLLHIDELVEGVPRLLGFEWFDMSQAITYGAPPNDPILVAVGVDPGVIAARLEERQFARRDVAGTAVWHRGEDGALAIAERDLADPFDGDRGMSQRIALIEGHLVNSAFWAPIEAIIRTGAGETPSLAQASDYRTLAQVAVDPATGELLQAMYLSPLEVGLLPGDPLAFRGSEGDELAEIASSPLPFYGLALLADNQAGAERVGVVALLYGDAESAELAAAELERRLSAYTRALAPDSTFSSDGPLVHESDTGLFAAVAVLRLPGNIETAGFPEWVSALFSRRFPVLAIPGVP